MQHPHYNSASPISFSMTSAHPRLSTPFSFALLLSTSLLHANRHILLNNTDKHGCGIGEEFRDGSCKLCLPGNYRFFFQSGVGGRSPFKCFNFKEDYYFDIEPSSSRCVKCPAGTFNPYPGAQSASRCYSCPSGTRSPAGAAKCQKCPDGTSSATGSPRCVKCQRGYYMSPRCVDEKCQRGLYVSSRCLDEKPTTRSCLKCAKGTYSTGLNTKSCTHCPPGMSTTGQGATSKAMCKLCGTHGVKCSCRRIMLVHPFTKEPWAAVGSYRPIGHSVCTRCPPGTRALSPYATKVEDCVPCPKDTYYQYLEGCQPCGEGFRSFGTGASSCRRKWTDDCSLFFKDAKGVCKDCPAGYGQSNILDWWRKQCRICPPGTVSGEYNDNKCRRCYFPFAAPENGDTYCMCRRGYRMGNGCEPCPKGTDMKTDVHGHVDCNPDCENFPDLLQCQTCKPGYSKAYGRSDSKCEKCVDGLVSLGVGDYCVHPQTGCRQENEYLVIASGKSGGVLSCISGEPYLG